MKPEKHSHNLSLPVETLRGEFSRAFSQDHLVITAPTGSGKSTLVPAWCLEELGEGARVLVVEPRRVACRALARFVSEAFEGQPGGTCSREGDAASGRPSSSTSSTNGDWRPTCCCPSAVTNPWTGSW